MRKISIADGDIGCRAEGVNRLVDGIVVLQEIHVHYTIHLPPETDRDKVNRALETHVSKCPMAQSIKDSVDISWTADVVAR